MLVIMYPEFRELSDNH